MDHYNVEGDEEGEGYTDEDDDGFIVDDEGRPIKEKKNKRKHVYHDAALQEAQDIFGVDFDYDEFEKYDEDNEDVSDDDYIEDEEDGERRKVPKPEKLRKPTRKSIFEIYEPIELKRGHFTDLDNQVNYCSYILNYYLVWFDFFFSSRFVIMIYQKECNYVKFQ